MLNITSQTYKHCVRYLTESCRLCSTKTTTLKNDQLHDIIGPPDPVSNLRPIIFARPMKETYLEKKYRELKEDTQQWNQTFWYKHNTNFIQERKQFQELLRTQGKMTLTADEMSVFYKQFLDKNWKSHFNYNIAWYKKNIKILFLGIAVGICKFKFK
ncbi:cytochrome c oxidase assembly factor 8 [Odontomachus brunneus]|uniref:cytochrome c oxidase assembly factor 8 n=1 Tax=Odontomachus brunneus TaxID=486640 RepID=UPI0013F1FAB8|nr:cytochrome c oxidase assembly factor 8 [Odontomachus brunneus]XP_032679825.1 cytochrome c oxidase assembly factor 8 [Odontomachus brunneus]